MKEKYLYIMLILHSFIVYMPIKCIAERFIDNDKEFEIALTYTEKPCLVIFSAPWCGICNTFKKTLSQLTEHPVFKNAITFITVNFDKAKRLCTQYNVDRIPTFIYIQDGNVVRKDVGIKRGINEREFFEKTILETFNLPESGNQKVARPNSTLKSTVAYFVTPPLRYIKNGIEWCIQKLST